MVEVSSLHDQTVGNRRLTFLRYDSDSDEEREKERKKAKAKKDAIKKVCKTVLLVTAINI